MKYIILLLTIFSIQTVFAAAGSLSGLVRDKETLVPLVNAEVEIPGLKKGSTTDDNGLFLLQNLRPGSYVVKIRFMGYKEYSENVTIASGEKKRITIDLAPTALRGKGVMVVATRARQGETPAASATLSHKDIQQNYFTQDIPVMLSQLPSSTFYSESGNGVGYTYLSIRGFDQRRISVMINGVPQNEPEDHNVYWLDFPDLLGNVEDVQVQRGAGSSFYGPPAIGGSVNIITSRVSPDRSFTAAWGTGTFNTTKYGAALNSGLLAGKYAVYAHASRIKSDGFREQSWVDFKSFFVGAARFGKKSVTRLHFYGGPVADHLAYYGISREDALNRDTRRTNPIARPDEIENFNQPHLELINEYQISPALQLNNTLFWIRGYGFFDYDGSWAPFSYYRLTPKYGFDVTGNPEEQYAGEVLIRAYVDNRQAGWMPQLTWTHRRGEVVLGAELRRHRSLHWGRIQKGSSDLPLAVSGDYSGLNYIGDRRYYQYRGAKDVLSPYVHSMFRLTQRMNLVTDLQFVYQRYRLYNEKYIGTDFSVYYRFLNPRVGINYRLAGHWNVFGSFSRTSREPRLKNFYDAAEASTPESWGAVIPQFAVAPDDSYDFTRPLVKPENLNDFELGIGYSYLDWRAHLNLFYMDFSNEIIKNGQLDRFGQPRTGNADRTLHTGMEISMQAPIYTGFNANGNLMISRNTLKRYTVYSGDARPVQLDGNPIAGFPNFLANARLTYNYRSFTGSLAMQHVGKQYTDNYKNEANTVDPYTVFNGMLGYRINRMSGMSAVVLQLHFQNIFDTVYIAHGEGADFFPAAGRQIFFNTKLEL